MSLSKQCNGLIGTNQLVEASKFEQKMKEFEGVCEPIIAKMYQQQHN